MGEAEFGGDLDCLAGADQGALPVISVRPDGMAVHSHGVLAVPRNAFLQPEPLVELLDDHRREVRQRIAGQQPPKGDEPARPYLLMLVRPDGILTYYQVQSALADLKGDFGYEFVEADWVLDFGEGRDVP